MYSVKEWQLINNNFDDVALNFVGSPNPFIRAFQILKARWCMGSHLVGSFQFQFQASV